MLNDSISDMGLPVNLLLLLSLLHYPLASGDIHARAVGKVRKFCKNRRIEYNLHLNVYSRIPEVEVGISILSDLCYNQKLNKICHRSIDNINSEYAKFKNKWEIIELNDITRMSRRKRHIENDLIKTNNITAKILKRAVDLADQGYGDLRSKIQDIRKEITHIMGSQNKLAEYVGYINFHSISQVVFETIHQMADVADSVLRLIIDNDTTSLVNLISLTKLKEQMQKLDGHAAKSNCTIPFGRNSFELVKYLSLCSVDVRIMGNIISINIKAPSVSTRVFTLVEPVSMPFQIKGSTYKEKPLHDNLLVHEESFNVRTYVPLSDRERNNCKDLPDGKMICYPSEPMLKDTVFSSGNFDELFSADSIDCATLLMDKNLKTTNCPVVQIAHRNMLIQFDRDIYTVYIVEPVRITIDCPDKSSEYIFNSTRALPIPKSCSVFMDNLLMVEKMDIPSYDIIYLSNNTSGIYITKNDLLNINHLDTVNLTQEFRNLNPDFEEISNDIDQQMYSISAFLSGWRLKDEVLLIIMICLSISIILNWITTCYYIRKLRRDQNIYYMEARPAPPVSMKKLSPMKTFANRMQSIERDFIKPFSPPRSDSLMLNMYDRQSSMPDELMFPSYPKPMFELKQLTDKKIETVVNFDLKTGTFETNEEIPFPPPPPSLLEEENIQ